MESKYPVFDRSRLVVKPLAERVHDLSADQWLALEQEPVPWSHPQLGEQQVQFELTAASPERA